ncbi:MAG: hypothetical protein KBD55_01975 [Candidatus Pacebacteria bacterium]|nr:hypothetical protein [Candidatus Paceibacterota bacterium]
MPRKLEDIVQKKTTKQGIHIVEKISPRPKVSPAKITREVENEEISPRNKKVWEEREEPRIERRERIIPPIGSQITTSHRYRVWVVALISILFLLFALSFLFSKAYIGVTPKIQEVTLSEHLSATKDATTDNLSYDLVVISGEETKNVKAGAEKDVSVKATGAVILYNNFGTATQALDIDTRLEGSNGKMYKTVKKVIIPGMSQGKPGSIEVGIYAIEAGAEYNSSPLDFKIYGFKGSAKYDKFYGRGKGSIAGGLKGKLPVVTDADKIAVTSELKKTLEAKLLKKATEQIPKGFILFKDAVFLSTNEPVIDYKIIEEGSVPLLLKGTLYGFIFDENKLTKQLAKDSIDKYDNSPVYIKNIKDLDFVLSNKENISYADVKNVDFTISGKTEIVWKFDENKFMTEILGVSKSDFNSVLSKYPNIKSAEMHLRPFWRTSLPGDVNDIVLTINYPK